MKSLNGSVLRCIFAIVLGLVLVLWPEAAVTYLVITIGICFIIPGLFSLLNYFTREKVEGEPSPMFPIDGAGSILFGAWLVIMPQFFVSILMYVLGALLVLAGAQQLISLVSARKWSTVSYVFLYHTIPDFNNRGHDPRLPIRSSRQHICDFRSCLLGLWYFRIDQLV